MVPKLTASAANVVWTLTRGPRHPTLHAARDVFAWAIHDGQGVQLIRKSDDGERKHGRRVLDLFSTRRAAQRAIDGWDEDTEERPVRIEGAELLAALASAEEVDIDEYDCDATIIVDGDAPKFLDELALLLKRRRR